MYILGSLKKHLFLLAGILVTLIALVSVPNVYAFEDEIMPESEESEPILFYSATLRGGWYNFEPYQYQIERNGLKTLTGLDYELMNAISKEANVKLQYEHVYWEDLQEALKQGTKDFATGVLYTKERAEYAYFSIPYRYAEASFFVPWGKIEALSRMSSRELVDHLKQNQLKIAVVAGFVYSDPTINQFVGDPNNSNLVVKTHNDNESLDMLLNGDVDGFFADRIVGSTLIWHSNQRINIVEHRLEVRAPIHLMFSKKTVTPAIVEKYNESIKKIMDLNVYRNIVSWYLYPAIVFQIRDALWFRITEIMGVVAFAISGLLIAFRERATLFGAVILAILPSLGGGLIRDVIFGRNPVGALRSPIYLSTVLITVLVGFIIIKLLNHYKKRHKVPEEFENMIRSHASIILTVTDAIGLATFTVVGVMVSLLAKANPLWLWGPFFAFVTGAGGGILRDMISKTRYIEALEGEFYGELAIIWGFFLSVYILMSTAEAQPEYIGYAVITTIVGVFVSRLLIHYLHVPNIYFKRFDQK